MLTWDHGPVPRHRRPGTARRAARAAIRGAARALRCALRPEHALYEKLEDAAR